MILLFSYLLALVDIALVRAYAGKWEAIPFALLCLASLAIFLKSSGKYAPKP